MANERFAPITGKINRIIIISLVIGLGGIIYYYANRLSNTLNTTTRQGIELQTQLLTTVIEEAMLPGEAPIAESFIKNIEGINDSYTIRLFRINGTEAFSDNTTILMVNSTLGRTQFNAREQVNDEALMVNSPRFLAAVEQMPPENTPYLLKEEKKDLYRCYKTLQNTPRCNRCHGKFPDYRGVLEITTDITPVMKDQQQILIVSMGMFIGVVMILAFILTQYLQNTIIRPIKVIGLVCANVTEGNFQVHVDVENRDEIGMLGDTVNTMVEGLYERFELSKYVSTSTIASIKNSDKGTKVPATLFFSDIRGFTSYSEKNPPEQVVNYLNKILNFQTEIIHKHQGDVDKYVGDEIVATYDEDISPLEACRTALEIQLELQENSDSLYGGLRVGIGISYGEVIMGRIGSDKRADYTVIGDTVNTASRLCSSAKKGQIIIADAIYKMVKEDIVTDGPYKLKVKGKDLFLRVYILTGMKADKL